MLRNTHQSSNVRSTTHHHLLIGFIFHAAFLISIFDIYFVSPVLKIDRRFSVLDSIEGEPRSARKDVEPMANRVVLIVGDGLRADKLFSLFPDPPFDSTLPVPDLPDLKPVPTYERPQPHLMTPAPYLRSLIETRQASWGLSHTRVPTESRPGHVAIIAGMYEDVSAVTRGWKMNPVNFDSVFNQSSHSFTFGSPDILPMFKHGASDPLRVDAWSYDESDEDFTKDAAELDIWVLDRLKKLLSDAKLAGQQSQLYDQLHSKQLFFFLHLLGLDTTGHSYRPHSPEYLRNVQVVDQVVRGAQKALEEFYGDDRTAYIFTADHGMSNIGNHGDGDPDNTRTPIIAWGSGINHNSYPSPLTVDELSTDPYFAKWYLDGMGRMDIEQADIAPLMATLAGIPIPANSVGRLPMDYLNASSGELARASYANMREILQQYETKHALKASTKFAFRPFPELPDQESIRQLTSIQRLFHIHRLILTGRHEEAMKASAELKDVALRGLRYLQRYDWFLLRTLVTSGYLGWMILSAIHVLVTYALPQVAEPGSSYTGFGTVLGYVFFIIFAIRFYLEQSPFTYYFYIGFPAYFWARILNDLNAFQDGYEWALSSLQSRQGVSASKILISSLLGLECMVLGYFQRFYWSLGWVVIGVVWPVLGTSSVFRSQNRTLLRTWTISALISSLFTLLPVEKGESLPVLALGCAIFLCGAYIARKWRYSQPSRLQVAFILAASVNTMYSAHKLSSKQGLPRSSQVLGWVILIGSVITPLFNLGHTPLTNQSNQSLTHQTRLLKLIFSFVPAFIILSLSYEIIFYFCFSLSLLVWIELETRLADAEVFGATNEMSRPIRKPLAKYELKHIRLALFFLFFIHVGFFGTGNVASISSFYLEPVYRLVPVFNPFLMSSLLVMKILIPFLIVSCAFTALNRQLQLPRMSLFVSTFLVSDVLTLNFFFLVTDQGSWLEIGQSISHFAIASLLLVWTILLHSVGEVLLGVNDLEEKLVAKDK